VTFFEEMHEVQLLQRKKQKILHGIIHSPDTSTSSPAFTNPLFGLTQYRLGAVVLTLKHTRLSDGFLNFR